MANTSSIHQAVFQALPVPTLLLHADTPDFSIADVNEAYCSATGMTCEALVGARLFDAFPDNPDDGAATGVANLRASLEAAIASGEPQVLNGQKYEIRPGGSKAFELRYWDLISVPLKDADGRVTHIIHNVSDVSGRYIMQAARDTAEKETENSLRLLREAQVEKLAANETAQLLHAIVDTAQAGIFLFTPVFDAAGKIVDFRFRMANKMLAAYVGQSPEAITGALGSRWFPAYKENGLFERYSDTAINGNANRFEFHYNADGIDVWLDIMSTPVNGEALVTFTDYTAMKNLQRRLEGHVEELRGSNTNLEQFAYIASHDLQEPLRKVKSFGDMLQNRYADQLGPAGADLITRMQSAAGRMSILIDDLLTYSRASVKPGELTVLDANKVLDGALIDMERSIQQQGAVIKADKLAPIAGQATQIGQIFLNLIGNALKFHLPSQPPEIRISSTIVKGSESGLKVAAADAGKSYQLIRVQDKGIGFDNTYRDRIFQIFQRLNTRSEYAGSGVGLSIVKKVVENHNGYIEAESEPGKGAGFSILLPAVDRAS